MGNDVLPGNDAQFEIFQAHFITTLTKSPAKFGVTAEDVAALAAAQKGWSVAYPAHLKAQQDAQALAQIGHVGEFGRHRLPHRGPE